ncbi:hypothetical protein [Nocardioides sp.]|uniref:hypothetical protein n=1 Tax=Nocardioides sp. TaxID=35761 RepID=UPI0026202410|nr:hypothetical protein [Nocardioides sp.]MCU1438978.1 hypothetical protein [Naasia sp.]MCW2738304.1 hypothetical protein [Nocardioides sp.]
MKKTAIATTFVALSTMLIAPSAQAAPYPRSIDTACVAVAADSKVGPGDRVKVTFKWTADGNITPQSRVTYTVTRKGGGAVESGFFWSGAKKQSSVKFFRFARNGNYYVDFETATKRTSVFRNCEASTSKIKVRNRF